MFLQSMFWLWDLVGKMHPIMVHFPIGLFIGAFILESWARLRRKRKDYSGMVYLGALTALVATVMGWLLHLSDEYDGNLLDRHEIAGYASLVLSLITAWVYWRGKNQHALPPFVMLGLTCASIGITGHLGASITHGSTYLSSALPGHPTTNLSASDLERFESLLTADSFPEERLVELNRDVRAIFAHHCYQCHSINKRKGGLALDNRESIFVGGDSGPVFKPGHADASEIVRRITLPPDHEESMPQKGKFLLAEQIDLIKLWIDQGAFWSDDSIQVFREAELALTRPSLPSGPNYPIHPIDQFVQFYFDSLGVDWPAVIEDDRFIRRAYLDITGLLPTPEAIQRFTSDQSKNKRDKLILSLLDDQQAYVSHWMSFWNDLLRNDYSGTGFITGGRKAITDWIYQALSENEPYNEMATGLINPSPASEGFIKGIQWRGAVNSSQRTEMQAAQNISQSLMGLNLKCASCHNSFVNNLTLDQAYGFASIFADRPMEIFRCDQPTGRMAQPAFVYPELGEIKGETPKARLEELAKIIVQPANGRLYRTIVNRFWHRLLGRGLIEPVDDMDQLSWNQELLDWLAVDFIDHGYDLKHLLIRIMTSKVYQLEAFDYPSPEYLRSESFVFRGPTVRRLTAEQFIDAFAQVVTPMYHGLAYDPSGRKSDAKWIWHREVKLDRTVLPDPGKRYFRKQFTTDQPQKIDVLVTADHSFRLYVNGQLIGSGNDWRHVYKFGISPNILQAENTIAIEALNDGEIPNPAGLLFAMRIEDSRGDVQMIHSDDSWSTSDTLYSNWTTSSSDNDAWERAWVANGSHWGRLPDFDFASDSSAHQLVRAALVKQDDFMNVLGRPMRENVATTRDADATLLQALMMSNSTFLHEQIQRGAIKWQDEQPMQIMNDLYLRALGRHPTRRERRVLTQFVGEDVQIEEVEDMVWTVLLLPEFQLL